jgi:hypothetical protein
MAVTTYAASGQLALSAFRSTVVGASDSVSMSKLTARDPTGSTTTTDIEYTGTNVPWNRTGNSGTIGTNASIPTRTSGDPTPAIAISDFHGAIPWFVTRRTNKFHYEKYVSGTTPGDGKSGPSPIYGTKVTWDDVIVHTQTTDFPVSITTGGYTYYRGHLYASNFFYRIGRD